MKVLIAEDDNITSEMLTATIRKWGFEPVPVDDGDKALNVLHMASRPPIALLDWNMPVKSGLEVLKAIRFDIAIKNTYVIMLTALGDTESVATAIKAGANDYVVKPYESPDLHLRLMKAQRLVEKMGFV
jgi:DNA-binding response OmpR family regulator